VNDHERVRRAATLCEYGQRVLTSPVPEEKARLTHEANERWSSRTITDLGDIAPPAQPARPLHPELRDKRSMPGAKERTCCVATSCNHRVDFSSSGLCALWCACAQ
jgi:hypothetical protein